mgnify:CR=1 FL=1
MACAHFFFSFRFFATNTASSSSLINTTYINHFSLHRLGQRRKRDRFTSRRVVYAMFRSELNSIFGGIKLIFLEQGTR